MDKQCEMCMNLAFDEEYEEHYCSVSMDQDEISKSRYDKSASCPYFRMGDDYTIVKKTGI